MLTRSLRAKSNYYFGGRSSPLSQPIASPALSGSGRSHCSHRNERGPLPPGANASRISEPHSGHRMALGVCSMRRFLITEKRVSSPKIRHAVQNYSLDRDMAPSTMALH